MLARTARRLLLETLAVIVLWVDDLPALLYEASHADKSRSARDFNKVFANRLVRRKLRKLGGTPGSPLAAGRPARAAVSIPEWTTFGRFFMGANVMYFEPEERETLALLALWTGEGAVVKPGGQLVCTRYHPNSPRVRELLRWEEITESLQQDQVEILNALLADGVEPRQATATARSLT